LLYRCHGSAKVDVATRINDAVGVEVPGGALKNLLTGQQVASLERLDG
jgi:hypothetical protein